MLADSGFGVQARDRHERKLVNFHTVRKRGGRVWFGVDSVSEH